MKFLILFFVLSAIADFSLAVKKNHHGKSQQHHATEASFTHSEDLQNHLNSNNERKEQQNDAPANSVTSQGHNSSGVAPPPKKNILKATAEEHNVNKKQLDNQDGIPMETEHLIHVTPKPPNQKKAKKAQGQKRRPQNPGEGGKQRKGSKDATEIEGDHAHGTKQRAQNKSTVAGVKRSGKKTNKNRKYPKKYNPQKHNLKKNQEKKKSVEKNNEKRDKMKEKREKRNKLKSHDTQ